MVTAVGVGATILHLQTDDGFALQRQVQPDSPDRRQ